MAKIISVMVVVFWRGEMMNPLAPMTMNLMTGAVGWVSCRSIAPCPGRSPRRRKIDYSERCRATDCDVLDPPKLRRWEGSNVYV
jgi:hypothetical protein